MDQYAETPPLRTTLSNLSSIPGTIVSLLSPAPALHLQTSQKTSLPPTLIPVNTPLDQLHHHLPANLPNSLSSQTLDIALGWPPPRSLIHQ